MTPTRTVRLLVTLAAPLVVWALGFVPLPGLQLPRGYPASAATSIVALGLAPFLSATLLVELVARLVPGWNRLRHEGREGRAALRRAAVMLTLLLALVQSFFLMRYLVSVTDSYARYAPRFEGGVGTQWVATATLLGGVFAVLALAGLVDRFGLGSGVSVLLAGALLTELATLAWTGAAHIADGAVQARDLTTLALELGALVAASAWLLRRYRRAAPEADGTPPVRDPASGLVPPLYVGQVALMGGLKAAELGWVTLAPGPLRSGAILAVAGVAAVLGCTWLFQDRRAGRRALGVAAARAAVFVVALVALELYFADGKLSAKLHPLDFVILTAVALDLIGEWRARRVEPALVPIYVAPSVPVADRVLDALAAADVPVFARGIHHRALLQFFGPYVAITLLVPAARRDEAVAHLPR
jgi:hypothetical protein